MTGDLTLQDQEKKDKRIAAAVSLALHGILLVLLFFIMAWRAKNPPDPEMGIEIALGFSEVGSGEVKTTAVPNPSPVVEDSKPPAPQPEVAPVPKVTPSPVEPVSTPKAEPIVTTTAESPVVVKEEVKPKPTPQPKEEVVKPKEEVVKKEEPVKEPEKPKAIYPGKPKNESGGTGTAGTTTAATGNSSGDDADVAGDKGNPEGKVDSRNLYGKPGGGAGGPGLSLPGWRWDNVPRPNDTSNESGRLVFEIKIDKDGQIESVRRREGNVSPALEKLYRDEIYKTTFSRTNSGVSSSVGATGTVTFIIQAR